MSISYYLEINQSNEKYQGYYQTKFRIERKDILSYDQFLNKGSSTISKDETTRSTKSIDKNDYKKLFR